MENVLICRIFQSVLDITHVPGIHDLTHYDLLHFVRRFWKHSVYDCRLSTIENQFLGIKRDVDIPGMLVPEWYSIY